jgi:hypothetical protein
MVMMLKILRNKMKYQVSLAHIGSFLSERNPAILWESLVELLSEVSDFKRTLRLS